MIAMLRNSLWLAAAVILAGLLPLEHAAAEEQSLKVFSVWQGDGHIVQTGADAVTYMGVLSGHVYIDTDEGPVAAGELICPVVVQVNLKDRTQKGTGQCTITGPKGNQVFIDLSCTGVPLVGCAGDSKFTGGTGPFTQITGGGHFVIRSNLHQIAASTDTSLKDSASGIIFWRDLHYKTP